MSFQESQVHHRAFFLTENHVQRTSHTWLPLGRFNIQRGESLVTSAKLRIQYHSWPAAPYAGICWECLEDVWTPRDHSVFPSAPGLGMFPKKPRAAEVAGLRKVSEAPCPSETSWVNSWALSESAPPRHRPWWEGPVPPQRLNTQLVPQTWSKMLQFLCCLQAQKRPKRS